MPTVKIADKPTLDRVAEGVDGLVKRTPFDLNAFMYWFGGLASHTPGDDVENWMQGTMAAVNVPTATKFRDYALYECKQLMSVSAPLATEVGSYAFAGCSNLTTVNLPSVQTINGYCFHKCSILRSISLPEVRTIRGFAFYNECNALEAVDLPKLETMGQAAFHLLQSLKRVELPSIRSISTGNFPSIETVVLPGESVPTLSAGAFNYSCKIYVPRALLDSYQTATNWVEFYNRGQILAIEDHPEIMGGET